MKAVCGADCSECDLLKSKKCKGCNNTKCKPFGKKCWVANYIEIGGKNSFDELKKQLINEFNSLNIEGMPKINELYALHGEYVNLEYTLPNNNKIKFINDDEAYLGNQVENIFNDDENKKCFGLICNMNF